MSVTITSCFSSYFLGYELTVLNVLLNKLLTSDVQYMVYTTLFPIAAVVGVFFGRHIMNNRGRRAGIIAGNLIGSIGTIICVFDPHLYLLAVGRIIVGFAVGISNISAPFYIKEIIPVTKASMYLLSFHLSITFGLFTPFLLTLINPVVWWWRILFALPVLPNLIQLYLLVFVVKFDTPFYHYFNKAETSKAMEVLKMIYKEDLL